MTGLDLESFLHLLRADFGAWLTLGTVILVLALMAWTSWGSRRALRKCLVLSVLAHLGLAFYGGSVPLNLAGDSLAEADTKPDERIRRIEVSREGDPRVPSGASGSPAKLSAFDTISDRPILEDTKLEAPRPNERPEPIPLDRVEQAPLELVTANPNPVQGPSPSPEERPKADDTSPAPPPTLNATDPDPNEIAPVVVETIPQPTGAVRPENRIRPERTRERPPINAPRLADPANAIPLVALRPKEGASEKPERRPQTAQATIGETTPVQPPPSESEAPAVEVLKTPVAPSVPAPLPESNIRRGSRPDRTPIQPPAERPKAALDPLAMARVNPGARGSASATGILKAIGGRPLSEVPEVYRSRLDPNRSATAYKAGANPASEQAVERALDWLARHQDADGRWDGATARADDGRAVENDNDFTAHCPPGEVCFGECAYWEADTALTGLALLTYLGAGYTQVDGKYASTVAKGLDFLRASQKKDGDLRGRSKAVGMYCHAMATIALCEAYALTGDAKLRGPAQRAIAFLVGARAKDGMAWRYMPGAPTGDTSILGWVVMALKSAKELGIPVPPTIPSGTLRWLDQIAAGDNAGLGRYQTSYPVTATMTAEAWVCRQFLGAGGPGPASTEAAAYLLDHAPKSDTYNIYYWYYGTLAMYQHGGEAWTRWNNEARDEIVRRQVVDGHSAGSGPPDESPYGTKGGRIYATALATLSLEVYYRYLRLYDTPKLPATVAPATPPRDAVIGRARR